MGLSADEMNKLKLAVFKIVDEKMTSAAETAKTDIDRMVDNLFQQSSVPLREMEPPSMELRFRNKVRPKILTGEEIRGEGDTPLEVILVDTCTGGIVDAGPIASASVEIVLKEGESDNTVQVEQGKRPFLYGNMLVKLERGKGFVRDIKFRNHTVKMDILPVFRLGARVMDSFGGTQVKEATTQIFTVKDFRYKYSRKHDIPSLSDKVWRLHNIQKDGRIDERLRGAKVITVEDFLIRLLIDPQELQNIAGLGRKKWDTTVKHARACSIGQRKYCYINSQKTGIVFDPLGNVLGLILNGRYTCTDILSGQDKAHINELLKAAIENWEETKCFVEDEKLQYHLMKNAVEDTPSSFQQKSTSVQLCNKLVGPSQMIEQDSSVAVDCPVSFQQQDTILQEIFGDPHELLPGFFSPITVQNSYNFHLDYDFQNQNSPAPYAGDDYDLSKFWLWQSE